ncbi:hypothetical protein [Bradyrhizobium cosmicum]|uniref:hypothetical protein n=1 Tax=Bradyrhizobium cosmicum TaxID=1404864 RepID=UPI0028EC70A1|nr:hypothetical protein [Bradyrhizobium cosmicum]
MTSEKGPNIKKKQKCKNCEGKGLLKKGDTFAGKAPPRRAAPRSSITSGWYRS